MSEKNKSSKTTAILALVITELVLFIGFLGLVGFGLYQAVLFGKDLYAAIYVIINLPATIEDIVAEKCNTTILLSSI